MLKTYLLSHFNDFLRQYEVFSSEPNVSKNCNPLSEKLSSWRGTCLIRGYFRNRRQHLADIKSHFFPRKTMKGTSYLRNSYVHCIFTMLLIKQIFGKNKSSRTAAKSWTQFWARISSVNNAHCHWRELQEISPVPASTSDDIRESFICKALSLTGRELKPSDLQACHRLKKKDTMIVKFKCRKQKRSLLINRKNL